jgi:hypothetical protein
MRPTSAAAAAAAKKPSLKRPGRKSTSHIPTAGLTADVSDGKSQATALSRVGFPVYYPRLIKTGTQYCAGITGNCPVEIPATGSYPREYAIHDQHHNSYRAYRMTLEMNPVLGQYYGVQGTTWKNPPLLDSPSQVKTVAGKKLFVYAQGGKITDVAWHTPQAVYWISNTLTTDISNQQMVGIAASLTKAG